MNALGRRLRLYAAIAIIATGFLIVETVDDKTDPRRAITITVTWRQRPNYGPGHIDAMGQIGKSKPFFAEASDDNPFIESGLALSGERVTVTAWATDGPFAAFTCKIAGPVGEYEPVVWSGLQVKCVAIVN